MSIAACPLDDDRGTCKVISVQFVLSVLCVKLIILCLTELRRDGVVSRTAHDCHKYLKVILLFRLSPLI